MLRRALFLGLVLLVAASGCTMSRDGRRGTIITGGVMTATSVLLIRSGETDNDYNGVNDTILDDDWGAYLLGTALLIAGVTVLVGGLASSEEPQVDRSVTYLPSAAASPPPPISSSMYSSSAPGATMELAEPAGTPLAPMPSTAEPTQVVEIERRPVVPLPELPATADVLRLAKQVRSASTHGRCDAAWIMWMDLEKLDATYARALRDGRVMARCAQ
jgi:hypothetical protein